MLFAEGLHFLFFCFSLVKSVCLSSVFFFVYLVLVCNCMLSAFYGDRRINVIITAFLLFDSLTAKQRINIIIFICEMTNRNRDIKKLLNLNLTLYFA